MDMKKTITVAIALFWAFSSAAFCGFYVAKAGAKMFNNKSEVILVRDGSKSVITMSNDFKGDVSDFAMVVPVPEILRERDIKIVDRSIFDRLDAYSAPRLVEYYDPAPCLRRITREMNKKMNNSVPNMEIELMDMVEDKDLGVTIEASYSIGEYEILILSATESNGLKTWLTSNGYAIPQKAEKVLEPYIKSNMKFFVVKVNLEQQKKLAYNYLRPIQITFNSEKFMLPIRLGMANSTGEQDMIVYAFTKTGRVEAANYRTVEMPTARKVPTFVKPKFEQFYFDLFDKSYSSQGKKAVFLEYAWNVTPTWGGVKCDPCIGPPPITNDLLNAGVDWVSTNANQVYFTRLHVRYTDKKFPQDLMFIVTPNKTNYQSRYIITHPATGDMTCDAGKEYVQNLKLRRSLELHELEALTDWNTDKYTKYVSTGSGWADERRRNVPLIGPNGKSDPPNGNIPWSFLLLMTGIVLTGSLYYLRDKLNINTEG
jgi:hypothetical protein